MVARSASHKNLQRRLRRTMHYGSLRMDTLSAPLSEMLVDYFDQHNPYDNLNAGFASKLARECCIEPTTLIVAMLYIDRLRAANVKYFTETPPEDIYLAALVIACKFLQDGGLDEFVWNDEWAQCSSRSRQYLNALELDFLQNVDWNLHITESDFQTAVDSAEQWIALHSLKKNNFLTYNDFVVLVRRWNDYWIQVKAFCVYTGCISAAYVGSLALAFSLSGMMTSELSNNSTASVTSNDSIPANLAALNNFFADFEHLHAVNANERVRGEPNTVSVYSKRRSSTGSGGCGLEGVDWNKILGNPKNPILGSQPPPIGGH